MPEWFLEPEERDDTFARPGEGTMPWLARLTQEQLAERSGVGIATIVRVERNQVEPRGSTIRKLAEALDVEPEELVKAES